MNDPLLTLAEKYPYDPGRILASVRGKVYSAIMLSDGQVGVCATLGHVVEADPMLLHQPDLKRTDHRILVNAYFNASHNGWQKHDSTGDIFEVVDFRKTGNNLMVGYFPPLVEKFRAAGIPLKVFDLHNDFPDQSPIEELPGELPGAECLILTSTTLFNGTFTDIITRLDPMAEVYMLGPSTPLDPGLKSQHRIKRLFGMIFEPYDFEVLKKIGNGEGTRSFSTLGKKISL